MKKIKFSDFVSFLLILAIAYNMGTGFCADIQLNHVQQENISLLKDNIKQRKETIKMQKENIKLKEDLLQSKKDEDQIHNSESTNISKLIATQSIHE